MPPDGIRNVVTQNSNVLALIRSGLKKQSAVPVKKAAMWESTLLFEMSAHKQMAQLLVAEGLVHLEEGRTNEAANSFADCIAFSHAANRRGLMIHELVAIACQAIGSKRLLQVAPQVSPETLREILAPLIALDEARESASAILRRDRAWSRESYGWWHMTWQTIRAPRESRGSEEKFEERHTRSVAVLRLVMTELAVRGYAVSNGKLPTSLSELVPAWLPSVPIDPFSNQGLIYRVTTNSFLLYSVGPDKKDDGGAPLMRGKMQNGDLLPTSF